MSTLGLSYNLFRGLSSFGVSFIGGFIVTHIYCNLKIAHYNITSVDSKQR